MAVVDKGFGELIETLDRLPAVGPAAPTHERVAFVVDAVWHAFSSPTSMAALEILISTRSMRDAVANTHLAEIMKTFTALGRQIGEGLDAPDTTEIGNLIWATLRGLVVAQMVSPHPVDSARDRRALVDVISGYLRSTSKEESGPRRTLPTVRRSVRSRVIRGPRSCAGWRCNGRQGPPGPPYTARRSPGRRAGWCRRCDATRRSPSSAGNTVHLFW